MLTFLLGGARSGKSTLAQQIGERSGRNVTVVATAEPFDDDLRQRIERHRDDRPEHWVTIEAPVHLADAVGSVPDDHLLVIDCLTVWVANVLHHLGGDGLSAQVDGLLDALRTRTAGDTVVVSNEVGLGIHPETELGREYRDLLGRVNQRIAAVADTTLLLVAGRALRLDDPWTALS